MIVTAKHNLSKFTMEVLEHTAALFFLLEGSERLQVQTASSEGKPPVERGFGPSSLSVGLLSMDYTKGSMSVLNEDAARMEQLAYLGWVVGIAAAWEKCRRKSPYSKNSDLPFGSEAELFGDFQKIRNDLLKNRGVAQARNCGKCTVLKWFDAGDEMWVNHYHVLDFLHQLGGYLAGWSSEDRKRMVLWTVENKKLPPDASYAVVLQRAFIEAKRGGDTYELLLSIVFADGVSWTFVAKEADHHADLIDDLAALRAAPLDACGSPIVPGLGTMDVRVAYDMALERLGKGESPMNPGVPIRVR